MSNRQQVRRIAIGISFQENPFEPDTEVTPEELHLVDTAIAYAAAHGASLAILSALEHSDTPLPHHDTSVHDVLRLRIQPVHEALRARAAAAGVTSTSRVSEGRAWEVLVDEVKNNGADLVMVNQRRTTKPLLDRLLLGSNAARLIRHCPGHVWIVHPQGNASPSTLIVPVDLSDVSRRQLAVARELSETNGAAIHLLHSLTYPNDIALHRLHDAETEVAKYHAEVRARAEANLNALVGDEPVAGVHLTDEWIVPALPKFVAKLGADMVVMGTMGRTGVQGLLVGNTAEKIFRTLDVSSWVVKPDGWTG